MTKRPREGFEVLDWRDERRQIQAKELFTRKGYLKAATGEHLVFAQGTQCEGRDKPIDCTTEWVDAQGTVVNTYESALADVHPAHGYAWLMHDLRDVCPENDGVQFPYTYAPEWFGSVSVVEPNGAPVWSQRSVHLGGYFNTGPSWSTHGVTATLAYNPDKYCEEPFDPPTTPAATLRVIDPLTGSVVHSDSGVNAHRRYDYRGGKTLIDNSTEFFLRTLILDGPDQSVELIGPDQERGLINYTVTQRDGWLHFNDDSEDIISYNQADGTFHQTDYVEASDGTRAYFSFWGKWMTSQLSSDSYGRKSYRIEPVDDSSTAVELTGTTLAVFSSGVAVLGDSVGDTQSLIDLSTGDELVSVDDYGGAHSRAVSLDGAFGLLHPRGDELWLYEEQKATLLFDRVDDTDYSFGVNPLPGDYRTMIVETKAEEAGAPTGGLAVATHGTLRFAEVARLYISPRGAKGYCNSVVSIGGGNSDDPGSHWLYFADIPDASDPDTITLNIVPADLSAPPIELATMPREACRKPVIDVRGERVYWTVVQSESETDTRLFDDEVTVYSAELP
ncbi:hypothetical protein DN745_05620 [Bradymonas sediminis]|uniref:Uncharacterized protein n=1 Tax=Bradymonas sediminis TaxID=1548548 RepID=A0A2Z4FIW1_9DELT|nr:hypothetical protein DN745_05620 [Bradymonas sediminis]